MVKESHRGQVLFKYIYSSYKYKIWHVCHVSHAISEATATSANHTRHTINYNAHTVGHGT